jgi:hypothetical protein
MKRGYHDFSIYGNSGCQPGTGISKISTLNRRRVRGNGEPCCCRVRFVKGPDDSIHWIKLLYPYPDLLSTGAYSLPNVSYIGSIGLPSFSLIPAWFVWKFFRLALISRSNSSWISSLTIIWHQSQRLWRNSIKPDIQLTHQRLHISVRIKSATCHSVQWYV